MAELSTKPSRHPSGVQYMIDPVLRTFKEMEGKKVLAIRRDSSGTKITMVEPFVEPGDLIYLSWPFIWWSDPNLITWNGSEVILFFTDGPACFRVYAYKDEYNRYSAYRAW